MTSATGQQASGFQCVFLPLQIPVWRQHFNAVVMLMTSSAPGPSATSMIFFLAAAQNQLAAVFELKR
jgi:hypothetical protein